MLGGAIKDYVKVSSDMQPIPESTKQDFINDIGNRTFQGSPYQFLDYGGYNLTPTDNIPGYLLAAHQYESRPEEDVKNAITRRTSGHGADRDHPHVRHAIVHSLQNHQDLLHTYLNGKVHA